MKHQVKPAASYQAGSLGSVSYHPESEAANVMSNSRAILSLEMGSPVVDIRLSSCASLHVGSVSSEFSRSAGSCSYGGFWSLSSLLGRRTLPMSIRAYSNNIEFLNAFFCRYILSRMMALFSRIPLLPWAISDSLQGRLNSSEACTKDNRAPRDHCPSVPPTHRLLIEAC